MWKNSDERDMNTASATLATSETVASGAPQTPLLRRPIMAPVRLIIALVMVSVPNNLLRVLMKRLDATVLSPTVVSPIVRNAIFTVVAISLIYFAYALYVKLVEKRSVTELEGPQAAREIALGVALGALLFSTTIGILALLGSYRVTGTNSWIVTIAPALAAAGAAFGEEVLIRGIIFRILEEGLGTWIALACSAILFGAAHAMNPNATFVSSAAIALEAGVLLGAAFMLTRRLWFAIGIHFAWNFTQGAIFGAAVSGNRVDGLLQSRLQGAELISGGAFGPEASLIAVVICLIAAVFALYFAVGRGHVMSAPWREKRTTAR